MYTPILLAWQSREKLAYLEARWSDVFRDFQWLLGICLLVFPPFLLANHFYQQYFFGKTFTHFAWAGVPLYFLNQVILVALPEEIFFRGYLETKLTQVFAPKFKIWGAPFGWGVILSALVFAFSHSLIHFQWWHFSIFFPALLFSWFRQKTGTVWMGVLFHALCNLASYLISLNYH